MQDYKYLCAAGVNRATLINTHIDRQLLTGCILQAQLAELKIGFLYKTRQCGKSSESVQLTMLKACDACADMGQ